MEYKDFLTALEQFQAQGHDITPLVTAAQGLLDTGKTPLGLNQWKLTDKPRMEEFNEDNRVIDQELQSLHGELSNKANRSFATATITPNVEVGTYQYTIYRVGNIVYLPFKACLIKLNVDIALFTLPVGFRPKSTVRFVVRSQRDSNNAGGIYNYSVNPDGTIMEHFNNEGSLWNIDGFAIYEAA